MQEVTKTRFPQTIGDDHPSPGKSVFQATFFPTDQRSGGWTVAAADCRPERNCGAASILRLGSSLAIAGAKLKNKVKAVCSTFITNSKLTSSEVRIPTYPMGCPPVGCKLSDE